MNSYEHFIKNFNNDNATDILKEPTEKNMGGIN